MVCYVLAQQISRQGTTIVDPNTLNLDPDSKFWPQLDLNPVTDPDPGFCYQFEKKKKNSFREEQNTFFLTVRK